MYETKISMNQFPLPYDQKWKLSESEDSAGNRYIRLPIAVLGEWVHPQYGPVTFSQKDFDQIQTNWNARVTGYEPPLYLGHPTDRTTVGGAPAVAFLNKLYQESDTLFGEYDPVDDEVFQDTKQGKFRYSSAEIVREANSKETGESIGTLLVGAALTNTPFLTRMPRVEAGEHLQFSESEGTASTLFAVSVLAPSDSSPMTVEATPATPAAPAVDVEKFTDLVTEVETLRAELRVTQTALAETTAKLKAQALDQRLSEVNSLNLAAPVKERYSEMLRTEVLSEDQAEQVMSLMRSLSDGNKQNFTEPRGSQEAVVETAAVTATENPYASIIAAHQAQLAARAAA
jgi:hypothetical protein